MEPGVNERMWAPGAPSCQDSACSHAPRSTVLLSKRVAVVAKAYCCLWTERLTHSCRGRGHAGQRNPVSVKGLRAWAGPYSDCSPWGPFHSMLPPPHHPPLPTLTRYPLLVWIQLESFLLITIFVFFKCISVGGSLRAGSCLCQFGHAARSEVGARPRMAWSFLALSILCPRSARSRPGRRLVHVRGPSGQTPAGGGGLGSGGHLQPPDRDLSCSPDLTQSFPNAPGHPSPESAPRRSSRFHRPHPNRGHPPPTLLEQPRAPVGSKGQAEAKGHLLGHLLHHLPPFPPHSISPDLRFLTRYGCHSGQEPPSSHSP